MISVIVPVYNVSKFLDACLESIVSQSFRNLEIILVDDGSTDDSGEKCDYWALKDNRIKVIHKKNGGLSDARNEGLKIASGEYLAFIDSDDEVEKIYFEYLHSLIEKYDADISVCGVKTIDENGKVLNNLGLDFEPFYVSETADGLKIYLEDKGINVAVWGKLYKTTVFKEGNISFPMGKYNEDVFVTYRILALCNTFAIGSKRLYNYRQRSSSIMNQSFNIKHFDTLVARVEQQEFIEKNFPGLTRLSASQIIQDSIRVFQRISKSEGNKNKYYVELYPYLKRYLRKADKSDFSFKKKCYVNFLYIVTMFLSIFQ